MPNLFLKLSRKSRRQKSDGKTVAMTEAGIRLLARYDYEAISMARIAREAHCSVGAFYGRYPDKNAYLYRLIGTAFRDLGERARETLEPRRWPREGGGFIARQIVSHVVSSMTAPRAAGVIRAAVKLATVKPLTAEPFEDYRKMVTALAVDLLAHKSKASHAAIRIAVQIVLGTITDSILQKHPGALNPGSARMIDALTNVLTGYLGLSRDASWAQAESDDSDDPDDRPELGSETPLDLAEGEVAIFDPDNRTYLGKRVGLQKKRRKSRAGAQLAKPLPVLRDSGKSKPANKPALINPARVPAKTEAPKEPARKLKHRFI